MLSVAGAVLMAAQHFVVAAEPDVFTVTLFMAAVVPFALLRARPVERMASVVQNADALVAIAVLLPTPPAILGWMKPTAAALGTFTPVFNALLMLLVVFTPFVMEYRAAWKAVCCTAPWCVHMITPQVRPAKRSDAGIYGIASWRNAQSNRAWRRSGKSSSSRGRSVHS